jgi:hypothetical protein
MKKRIIEQLRMPIVGLHSQLCLLSSIRPSESKCGPFAKGLGSWASHLVIHSRPVTIWWNSVSPYKVHSIVFEKALVEPFSTWQNGISPYQVHSIVRKTTHPYHHANFCSTKCTMTMWSCQLWFLGHKLWTIASSNIVMFTLLSLKIEEEPHKSVDFHV